MLCPNGDIFRDNSGWYGPEKARGIIWAPNIRYQQTSPNLRWLLPDPKYRSHSRETSQNTSNFPTALTTDMQKYMRILQTTSLMDWNPNLPLLFARIALTSYYKILFIKILFTITRQSFIQGTISVYTGAIFLSLPFIAICQHVSLLLSFFFSSSLR